MFAALGDVTRLALIMRLCNQGPLPIVRLCEGIPVTRQAVTKHLHALESAGLVCCIGAGRGRSWEIRTRQLAQLRDYLAQISSHWDQALSRLKILMET